MSPRAKKKSDVEASGEAVASETVEAPKKRGRPRKADAVAAAPIATAVEERERVAVAGNGRRGRRGRGTEGQEREAREEDADHGAGDELRAARSAGDPYVERDPREVLDRDEGEREERDDGDGEFVPGDGRDGRDRQGQRSRRNRGGQRKAGLNFRDLQGKIVPELHLLAKEVGLEQFREMPKETLVQSILERSTEAEGLRLVRGYLEISSDGYGFLQESLLQNNTRSVIVSAGLIKQFRLRTGDAIMGKARRPRDNERYGTLIRVEAVNGVDPFQASKRPRFDDLVPTFPDTRIRLEVQGGELSARVIDLLAPIGRGQRGLIVAPPKAGKTTLLKTIAKSVIANEPDIKVIVLLVDERPEEVTDFRESVQGVEVVASTFDEPPANHVRVAEFVHERARRIVEDGGHIMILLDSITRLARANNLVTPATGRTLSGGLDSNALHWPKRFLGAARNIRGGGSLSILATALVETGSRMDDVIFEEFKGTGNMELHLSRRLEERRIFPAIDILKSGTRREDLLLGEDVLAKMWLLRKVISDMDASEAMEMLLSRLGRTKGNTEFLSTLGQG
jgi:transcription termination factor Rho